MKKADKQGKCQRMHLWNRNPRDHNKHTDLVDLYCFSCRKRVFFCANCSRTGTLAMFWHHRLSKTLTLWNLCFHSLAVPAWEEKYFSCASCAFDGRRKVDGGKQAVLEARAWISILNFEKHNACGALCDKPEGWNPRKLSGNPRSFDMTVSPPRFLIGSRDRATERA